MVARLVAIVMDGVTDFGAEMEEEKPCVKAVFFDLDDTLVLTHAADKVAQQALTRLGRTW